MSNNNNFDSKIKIGAKMQQLSNTLYQERFTVRGSPSWSFSVSEQITCLVSCYVGLGACHAARRRRPRHTCSASLARADYVALAACSRRN